jgi:prepilin-type N-terminal cleavage/methylation domain-containing protein
MLNSPFHARSSRAAQAAGFTLVELLVVIGIIAILAGVAFPAITKGIGKARESAAMQTAGQIGLSEFQYQNDNSTYPARLSTESISLIPTPFILPPIAQLRSLQLWQPSLTEAVIMFPTILPESMDKVMVQPLIME